MEDTMDDEVVITAAARTPFGKLGGALSGISAVDLGAAVIREVVARSNVPAGRVGHVIMGTVIPAGLGQIPARQAAFKAGLPVEVPALTINKVCGSGLKAANLAALLIRSGEAEAVVAGGMESMSNAPYLLDRARFGYRMGHGMLQDAMIVDGLWSPTDDVHMGVYGSCGARDHGITRRQQDEWALRSQQRYAAALAAGRFAEEIIPIAVPQPKGGSQVVEADEQPRPDTTLERLAALKPAFEEDGTVTAGNAPGVNDGAAALMLMKRSSAERLDAPILATWLAGGEAAMEPRHMNAVPARAISRALEKANLVLSQIDLFEINEAFAAVTLVVSKILDLDPEKVNVDGGAVAIGHPIGASGARILMHLVYALRRQDARYGVVGICSGTAQGDATVVRVGG
jgi:acetyl-CoA C-acetyltransferase